MKRVGIVAAIAVVHLTATIALALKTFQVSGFIFGLYPQPNKGLLFRAFTILYNVLMFPLGRLAEGLGPGVRFLGWPLVVANSVLWAIAIYWLFARCFSQKRLGGYRPTGAA